jgi:hypothetical protein
VPPAIIFSLKSTDFEDAICNAVSIDVDTDILASITRQSFATAWIMIPVSPEARRATETYSNRTQSFST